MFSYPIKRQRILAAQMLAVWLFNFVASVLTKISIYLCVAVGARYMASSFFLDFHMGSISFYLSLLLKSAVVVSMSFIALFVGMALKSSKATIITSFFLIFLTQANVGDFTLANQMAVPIGLTVVSLGCAFGVVESAEKRELR